ncbi:unnamed protein product, partial [Ceratitis capitata]
MNIKILKAESRVAYVNILEQKIFYTKLGAKMIFGIDNEEQKKKFQWYAVGRGIKAMLFASSTFASSSLRAVTEHAEQLSFEYEAND